MRGRARLFRIGRGGGHWTPFRVGVPTSCIHCSDPTRSRKRLVALAQRELASTSRVRGTRHHREEQLADRVEGLLRPRDRAERVARCVTPAIASPPFGAAPARRCVFAASESAGRFSGTSPNRPPAPRPRRALDLVPVAPYRLGALGLRVAEDCGWRRTSSRDVPGHAARSPAPRSSSSSARKWTWKSTSPSSSSSFASSSRCAASASRRPLDGVGDDRAGVLRTVHGQSRRRRRVSSSRRARADLAGVAHARQAPLAPVEPVACPAQSETT